MSGAVAGSARRRRGEQASGRLHGLRAAGALVFIGLLYHPTILAGGQPPRPVVDIQISNARPQIAEPVTLRIDLTGIESGPKLTPTVGAELGPFRVIGVHAPGSIDNGQRQSTSWAIVIATLESGKLEIPAIHFDGATDDGRAAAGADTRPMAIEVLAPEVDLKGGLKPLKAPIRRSISAMIVAVAGLGMIAAVLAGILGTAVWRSMRKPARPVQASARDQSARLLAQLEALRTAPAATEEQRLVIRARLFHGIRQLIHSWLDVGAEALSSPELADLMARHGCSRQLVSSLGSALAKIDEARFGPKSPAQDDVPALVSRTLTAALAMRVEIERTSRRQP